MRFQVAVAPSTIDGKGAFSQMHIPAKRKVGELIGEIISLRKGRKIAKTKKRIALVELDYKYALLAADNNNPLRYVNHSCSPNTYMRIFKHHVEFYTLRPIKKSEELTANYGETHHEGKLKCRCNAPNCVGKI